jgi:hypothetical protein
MKKPLTTRLDPDHNPLPYPIDKHIFEPATPRQGAIERNWCGADWECVLFAIDAEHTARTVFLSAGKVEPYFTWTVTAVSKNTKVKGRKTKHTQLLIALPILKGSSK